MLAKDRITSTKMSIGNSKDKVNNKISANKLTTTRALAQETHRRPKNRENKTRGFPSSIAAIIIPNRQQSTDPKEETTSELLLLSNRTIMHERKERDKRVYLLVLPFTRSKEDEEDLEPVVS